MNQLIFYIHSTIQQKDTVYNVASGLIDKASHIKPTDFKEFSVLAHCAVAEDLETKCPAEIFLQKLIVENINVIPPSSIKYKKAGIFPEISFARDVVAKQNNMLIPSDPELSPCPSIAKLKKRVSEEMEPYSSWFQDLQKAKNDIIVETEFDLSKYKSIVLDVIEQLNLK